MNRTLASILLTTLAIIGYGFFIVNAAAPSGGYNPAETIQPSCSPVVGSPDYDADCFVKLITYTDGGVVGNGTQADPIMLKFLFENFDQKNISLGTGATTDSSHSNSIFIGLDSGSGSSGLDSSAFIGINAGANVTSASRSNFMGNSAGADADEASQSNFFGYYAGASATRASDSSFFGFEAGVSAVNSIHYREVISNLFCSLA